MTLEPSPRPARQLIPSWKTGAPRARRPAHSVRWRMRGDDRLGGQPPPARRLRQPRRLAEWTVTLCYVSIDGRSLATEERAVSEQLRNAVAEFPELTPHERLGGQLTVRWRANSHSQRATSTWCSSTSSAAGFSPCAGVLPSIEVDPVDRRMVVVGRRLVLSDFLTANEVARWQQQISNSRKGRRRWR